MTAAFFENVLDPAHVPVSHHNIIGSRYKDAVPLQITTVRAVTPEGGLKIEVSVDCFAISVCAPVHSWTSVSSL